MTLLGTELLRSGWGGKVPRGSLGSAGKYRGCSFSMTEDAIRGVIREVVEHSNGLVMILALRH